MRSSGRLWLVIAIRMLSSCGGAEDDAGSAPLEPGSVSCAAWADRELEQCPAQARERDFSIMLCEDDRRHHEPLGCGEPYARWVQCASQASYDCTERWPTGCEREFDAMRFCPTLFARRTLCSRLPQDDRCVGQPQPHLFTCFGAGPPECAPLPRTEAEDALDVGTLCCPSFAPEPESYFFDP